MERTSKNELTKWSPALMMFAVCRGMRLDNTIASLSLQYYNQILKFYDWEEPEEKLFVIVITSCIYLACKTTENLRAIRDIYNLTYLLKDNSIKLTLLDEIYTEEKPKVIFTEHQLLRILRFDVEIETPHKFLLNFAKQLKLKQGPTKAAWMLLNDCYLYKFAIEMCPRMLAVACIYLGIELAKRLGLSIGEKDVPETWFQAFDVAKYDLLGKVVELLPIWENMPDEMLMSNT